MYKTEAEEVDAVYVALMRNGISSEDDLTEKAASIYLAYPKIKVESIRKAMLKVRVYYDKDLHIHRGY